VKRGKERDKSNPAFMRLEVCFLVLPKILVFGMWHLVIGWGVPDISKDGSANIVKNHELWTVCGCSTLYA